MSHRPMASQDVAMDVLTGKDIRRWKHELARARIELFAGPPYYYCGSMAYEDAYLEAYLESPHALLVRCSLGGETAGLLTGMPMARDLSIIQGLKKAPATLTNTFYLGEYLVMPPYRGLGIAHAMHWTAEVFAQTRGFHQFARLTVVPDSVSGPGAQRPTPTERCLWHQLGYSKTGETCSFEWPTLRHDKSGGVAVSRSHIMELWLTKPVTEHAHPLGQR